MAERLALVIALALATLLGVAQAKDAAPAAADPVLEARMKRIAIELRCLVCQNQTIADSPAGLSDDLRREIREQLQRGATDQQVVQYMTDRYGDFIRYRPPVRGSTMAAVDRAAGAAGAGHCRPGDRAAPARQAGTRSLRTGCGRRRSHRGGALIPFVLIALAMALVTVLLLTRPLWWSKQAKAPADDLAAASEVARRPLPMIAGLSSFVVVLLAAGYLVVGAPLALDPSVRTAASNSGAEITFEQIEAMTQKLADRLKQQPDDVKGWTMLGRSYAVMGRHADAVPAFKQALALKPDDPNLLADYADALAVVNGRKLEGEPSKLIARALEIDPNNLKALSLAGTAAFLRKDFAGALRHWEKLAQVAPDSDFARQIQGGIDEARRLAGGPAAGSAGAGAWHGCQTGGFRQRHGHAVQAARRQGRTR